jgi:archaellum component FlaF (FlaF/FlaG flagellin family)
MKENKTFYGLIIGTSVLITAGIIYIAIRNKNKEKRQAEEDAKKKKQGELNKGTTNTQANIEQTQGGTQVTKISPLAESFQRIFTANQEAKKAKEKVTSEDVKNANFHIAMMLYNTPR